MGILGISNTGSKQLLMRRHTEWVNMVNANCDSSNPKTKDELLRDLRAWEKSQGSGNSTVQAIPTVMAKDFDGAAWASNHSDEFHELIVKARQKRKSPAVDSSTQERGQDRPASSNPGTRTRGSPEELTAQVRARGAHPAILSEVPVIDLEGEGLVYQNG